MIHLVPHMGLTRAEWRMAGEDSGHPSRRLPPSNRNGGAPGGDGGSDWFGPDSVVRRVSQEALGLLGGGRAVLLQLAHPLVAAGVADYSQFQTDPLARLLRTLDLMYTLVYDDDRLAQDALRRFHALHARVQGRLPYAAGCFPAGTPYTAGDPALKLWVLATLVASGLMAYERFVGPLEALARSSYYAEMRTLGQRMGIPESILPATLGEFQDYWATMLAGDTLAVTDTARCLARDVLHPRVGLAQSASAALLRFVTAGLLPSRFRVAYGLSWGPVQQWALDSLSWTTRHLRPVAPAWLWQSPQLRSEGFLHRLLWPDSRPDPPPSGLPGHPAPDGNPSDRNR